MILRASFCGIKDTGVRRGQLRRQGGNYKDMNETILVVDDEREIADLLEVYLKNDGYNVKKYYNGTDALRCAETENIDLAILDVMLRMSTDSVYARQ